MVKFAAELASPLNDPDKPFEHIAYTVPWNMAENPAISINGGYDKQGFPIGVQIIGRRFDDLGVLGMAKAFETRARSAKAVAEPACSMTQTNRVIPARRRRFALRRRNTTSCTDPSTVMPGLVPGIHVLYRRAEGRRGCRDKPGHDGVDCLT